MPQKLMSKKELKSIVNNNGFYSQLELKIDVNMPDKFKDKIPAGASYFEGVISTGDLNRNGYIIKLDAWKKAMSNYMQNPVILLQHNVEQPIGKCLSLEIIDDKFIASGYIYDELTGGLFGKGLLKALSTGHITEEAEFENTETGDIISEDDFQKLPWDEQVSGNWTMIVTKAELVEFSLVTIPSNRASMITAVNAIKAFLKNGKISELAINEVLATDDEDDKNEDDEEALKTDTTSDKPALESKDAEPTNESEKQAETPATEPAKVETTPEPAKVDEPTDSDNKIKISAEERAKLLEAAKRLAEAIEKTYAEDEPVKAADKKEQAPTATNQLSDQAKLLLKQMAETLIKQDNKINELENVISKIPVYKSEAYKGQFDNIQTKQPDNAEKATNLINQLIDNMVKL